MKPVQKRIEKQGYRFNFFQAVKLLESCYQNRPKIGYLGPSEKEAIKILPNEQLSFSPSDVSRINLSKNEDGEDKWTVFENFLGLYGPNSTSPMYIAEMIAQFPRDEDPLRDFLDIFNHRILSLYYRAWKKHNIGASIFDEQSDAFSKILYAMVGFDVDGPLGEWKINPIKLLRYSSYLSSNSRPASALESILSDFFELEDVSVVQFFPRQYSPSKSSLSRITNRGDGGQLGESFVIGETITDISGQFKIRLGSLTMRQFLDFQPGSDRYEDLVFLTKIYVKYQLGFTLELVLKPNQGLCITVSAVNPVGVLGQSAWIGSSSDEETAVTFEAGYDV